MHIFCLQQYAAFYIALTVHHSSLPLLLTEHKPHIETRAPGLRVQQQQYSCAIIKSNVFPFNAAKFLQMKFYLSAKFPVLSVNNKLYLLPISPPLVPNSFAMVITNPIGNQNQ